MERKEHKELKTNNFHFDDVMETGDIKEETNTDARAIKEVRAFFQWELAILRQILICILIIIFLGFLGKIPKIGSELIDRFRYVLKYGETESSQQKIYSFVGKQWNKVKAEVSSWFTVEYKEVLAPAKRAIYFSSPVYYFEQRDFSTQRVRFLLPLNSHVYASAPGIIIEITPKKNEGWKIEIDHGEGWKSIYYPCSQIYVTTGQWVKACQEIGSTGREFFWEVYYESKLVNPQPFLNRDRGLWR